MILCLKGIELHGCEKQGRERKFRDYGEMSKSFTDWPVHQECSRGPQAVRSPR
jgi:hypothetical protein